MQYSALIGDPTDHSVSPLLYRKLLEAAKINIGYEHIKVNVKSKDLQRSFEALRSLNFIGISVTQPHKIDIIKYLDKLDPSIKHIGAVNTVKLGQKTYGYNTDWLGIYASVKRFSKRGKFRTATIFGSGGAARAAIYAAKRLGVEDVRVLYLPNSADHKLTDLRSSEKSLGIAMGVYKNVTKNVQESDIIINATPTGMRGNEKTPFSLNSLSNLDLTNKLFFEVVFNPISTPLLIYFKNHGAETIDGLWMMIYQGIKALSIWLDQNIDVDPKDLDRIHKLLIAELKNV